MGSMQIGNLNAFLKSKSMSELVNLNKTLNNNSKANFKQVKIDVGCGDKAKIKQQLDDYLNPKEAAKREQTKIFDTSAIDAENIKMKVRVILDKIARGEKVSDDERKLAGKDAVRLAEFINEERKNFKTQLSLCKTKDEAHKVYRDKMLNMRYVANKLSKIGGAEMGERYVKVMQEEWHNYVMG